jgi:ribonuclease HII
LDDSKKLSHAMREKLRLEIEKDAIAWAVEMVDNNLIDEINILNASILAMHKAVKQLSVAPQLLLVDGNRFKPFAEIPHECIVKGDGLYLSIAAASILAKTHRDKYMLALHENYPDYNWKKNKGYPTLQHRKAIVYLGFTPFHRKTFAVQIKPNEQKTA